jgi:hypothetical protein
MGSLIFDCESCGGPVPAGRHCPHCSSRAPQSLRAIFLRFALLGAAACSSSSSVGTGPVALYGLPITCIDGGCINPIECDELSPGDVCTCKGTQTCVCTDAGLCLAYTDGLPDSG